ncbi:L,D-transpeptidase family protein [Clostridium uliginosum]|uniref:Putative peptidoglycan binding domain-containing protein n=1 Tax=Clostridium uliginosum TaxID=119641 RepID=A0A1I1NW93_9CLOT|nr:L,D-transpeptidase family protein [Clostridium uliginosum]SFD01817.1 Putative peptidoglycan binding domain-containing protein [Clostridium uliginosum]
MKRKRFLRNIFFVVTIIFIFNISGYTVQSASKVDSNKNLVILVDLSEQRIYLVDTEKNIILKKYSIASGKQETPSPIGTWKVVGMAKWSGGFGTRWIGLNVPWGKFGIHGTNRPGTIGSEASHGCIRMFNKDIEELYEYVKYGMTVTIYAGPNGPFEKGLKTLKPGDRGSAVLEVQRKMKEKEYYPGDLDGIYGDGMKQYVIKFRKDNNLTISHNIDHEFYEKLGIRLVD